MPRIENIRKLVQGICCSGAYAAGISSMIFYQKKTRSMWSSWGCFRCWSKNSETAVTDNYWMHAISYQWHYCSRCCQVRCWKESEATSCIDPRYSSIIVILIQQSARFYWEGSWALMCSDTKPDWGKYHKIMIPIILLRNKIFILANKNITTMSDTKQLDWSKQKSSYKVRLRALRTKLWRRRLQKKR